VVGAVAIWVALKRAECVPNLGPDSYQAPRALFLRRLYEHLPCLSPPDSDAVRGGPQTPRCGYDPHYLTEAMRNNARARQCPGGRF